MTEPRDNSAGSEDAVGFQASEEDVARSLEQLAAVEESDEEIVPTGPDDETRVVVSAEEVDELVPSDDTDGPSGRRRRWVFIGFLILAAIGAFLLARFLGDATGDTVARVRDDSRGPTKGNILTELDPADYKISDFTCELGSNHVVVAKGTFEMLGERRGNVEVIVQANLALEDEPLGDPLILSERLYVSKDLTLDWEARANQFANLDLGSDLLTMPSCEVAAVRYEVIRDLEEPGR